MASQAPPTDPDFDTRDKPHVTRTTYPEVYVDWEMSRGGPPMNMIWYEVGLVLIDSALGKVINILPS
jgi:hypothetical protein